MNKIAAKTEQDLTDDTRVLNRHHHRGSAQWTIVESQTPYPDGHSECGLIVRDRKEHDREQVQLWPDEVFAIAQAYQSGLLPRDLGQKAGEMQHSADAAPLPPPDTPPVPEEAISRFPVV